MSTVIPAVVVHPSTLLRDGLRRILTGARFRPVHTAANLDEASIRALPSGKVCVWLIGVEKFSASTCEFIGRLHAITPEVKTVILAQFQAVEDVVLALEAGVSGILSPDISSERLIKSLELIALGETVVPSEFLLMVRVRVTNPIKMQPPSQTDQHSEAAALPSVMGDTVSSKERSSNGQSATASAKALSRRETAIMRLLINGGSNKVIARQLVITEATVKVHIKAILRKLRLQNRTQAAMWAYNHLGIDGEKHDGAEAAFGALHSVTCANASEMARQNSSLAVRAPDDEP
jgi:two-component system nitrate/nitrite response regulator NarL